MVYLLKSHLSIIVSASIAIFKVHVLINNFKGPELVSLCDVDADCCWNG